MDNSVSAVILCRDSEKNILRCLYSIEKFATEIIIVLDTRTVDNTMGVIKTYSRLKDIPVKIYELDWALIDYSFAEARNFGIEKAKCDWICWPDSDEEFIMYDKIDKAFDYYCADIYNYCNDILDAIHPSPKIYKNNIGIRFLYGTHESIWDCLNNSDNNYKRGEGSFAIKHDSKTIEDVAKKNAFLLEKQMHEYEKEKFYNPYIKGQIASYYFHLKDWHKCILWAGLSMFDNMPVNCKAMSANLIAQTYNELQDEMGFISWVDISLRLCPLQLTARVLNYSILIHNKEFKKAEIERENIEKIHMHKASVLPVDILFSKINFITKEGDLING